MSAWTDVLTAAALRPWMEWAPVLLLASLRWLGCLLCLPGLGVAGVTVRMRIALALLLSIVMLPAVSVTGDGRAAVTSAVEWLGMSVGEFVIGCALGLGVRILFSALALAGELIDHQAGMAVRQVLDPSGEYGGPIGGALAWMGAAAILLTPPLGGHLTLVAAMLDQFREIPLGSVDRVPGSTLMVVLVQQALSLAVDVAAPMLAAVSLVTLAAGWLGRSTPRLRVETLVAPVRVAVCLAILTIAAPGLRDRLGARLEAAINVDPQLLDQTPAGR